MLHHKRVWPWIGRSPACRAVAVRIHFPCLDLTDGRVTAKGACRSVQRVPGLSVLQSGGVLRRPGLLLVFRQQSHSPLASLTRSAKQSGRSKAVGIAMQVFVNLVRTLSRHVSSWARYVVGLLCVIIVTGFDKVHTLNDIVLLIIAAVTFFALAAAAWFLWPDARNPRRRPKIDTRKLKRSGQMAGSPAISGERLDKRSARSNTDLAEDHK
jgi:hypothetical protein